MKKIFGFDVAIKPVAAARPRVTKFGTYNPKAYSDYKKTLSTLAKIAKSEKRSDQPLFMKLRFCFEVPRSWSKAKKARAFYHTSKPDTDNLVKAVKDALNGIVYVDDSQICFLDAKKHYGERSYVKCEVYELCD